MLIRLKRSLNEANLFDAISLSLPTSSPSSVDSKRRKVEEIKLTKLSCDKGDDPSSSIQNNDEKDVNKKRKRRKLLGSFHLQVISEKKNNTHPKNGVLSGGGVDSKGDYPCERVFELVEENGSTEDGEVNEGCNESNMSYDIYKISSGKDSEKLLSHIEMKNSLIAWLTNSSCENDMENQLVNGDYVDSDNEENLSVDDSDSNDELDWRNDYPEDECSSEEVSQEDSDIEYLDENGDQNDGISDERRMKSYARRINDYTTDSFDSNDSNTDASILSSISDDECNENSTCFESVASITNDDGSTKTKNTVVVQHDEQQVNNTFSLIEEVKKMQLNRNRDSHSKKLPMSNVDTSTKASNNNLCFTMKSNFKNNL